MKLHVLFLSLIGALSTHAGDFLIQHLSPPTNAASNTIRPYLRLTNTGTEPLDLTDRTLSWDILESGIQASALVGECWYVSKGSCSEIGISAATIPEERDGSVGRNIRFSLGLPSEILPPGSFLEIQWGFHEQGWQHLFSEIDDWSFTQPNGTWNPAPRVGLDLQSSRLPLAKGMIWMGLTPTLPASETATPGQVYRVGTDVWVRGANDWEILTQTIAGPRGEPGPIGPRGEPGPAGTTPDLTLIQSAISQLQADNLALRSENAQIRSQLASAQTILSLFSRSGNDLILAGVNLRIVDGSGRTESTQGKGNLILGYHQDPRLGSHNIVIGDNSAQGYGAIVTGQQNRATGAFNTILGGQGNVADGQNSVTLAGTENETNQTGSVLIAGTNNQLAGSVRWNISNVIINGNENSSSQNAKGATMIGGRGNVAGYSNVGAGAVTIGGEGNQSSESGIIVGGKSNRATGAHSVIINGESNNTGSSTDATLIGGSNIVATGSRPIALGGNTNQLQDEVVAIGGESMQIRGNGSLSLGGRHNFVENQAIAVGGYDNELTASGAIAVGGMQNRVEHENSLILSGRSNSTGGEQATVIGGLHNVASDDAVTIGGTSNNANGWGSLVAGGEDNKADGSHATVLGGRSNTALSSHSTVGGGMGVEEPRVNGFSTGGFSSP